MNQTHTFCDTLVSTSNPLKQLGWKPFFQQQLTLDDYDNTIFARVIAHHRSGYLLATETGQVHLNAHHSLPNMTVGDWVILNEDQQFVRLLDRLSLFSRKAAGSKVVEQLIAANVDTVFIVCSLNDDFNLSRIERYLALAHEAEVEPVIVLSKADLCDNTDELKSQVKKLDPLLAIETVNGLEIESASKLMTWCKEGQTLAFIGSSGVGKSTLVNALLGQQEQATGHIREDDSKGRHTTTSRSIHLLPDGGILIDTPGMRELQLADCESGVSEHFLTLRRSLSVVALAIVSTKLSQAVQFKLRLQMANWRFVVSITIKNYCENKPLTARLWQSNEHKVDDSVNLLAMP